MHNKENPRAGDSFTLARDMAGTIIYCRIDLGEQNVRVERGIVNDVANKRTINKGFSGDARAVAEAAKKYVVDLIKRLEGNMYVLTDSLVSRKESAVVRDVVELSMEELSTKVGDLLAAGDAVFARRAYEGRDVVVELCAGQRPKATVDGKEEELPPRIMTGLSYYSADKVVRLVGTLTWVNSRTGTDHATRHQVAVRGGGRPHLVLHDLDNGEALAKRVEKLHELCEKYKWVTTRPGGSSIYATVDAVNKKGWNAAKGLAKSDAWSGVAVQVDDATVYRVQLRTTEYLITVAVNEDASSVLVAQLWDSGGYRPRGAARVPTAMRSTYADLCVVNDAYTDHRNPTKIPPAAYGVASGEYRWIHPSDFFVSVVDLGVVLGPELARDVQECTARDPDSLPE